MWSDSIEILNPYEATIESIRKEEENMANRNNPWNSYANNYRNKAGKVLATVLLAAIAILLMVSLSSCDVPTDTGTKADITKTQEAANTLSDNQATPTDINYSLERYNLIRRAYWVNGQREKANTLVSAVDKPLGYIVLFTESGSVIGRFIVDGKVSSLNSFLSPNYVESYYSDGTTINKELPDIDGSYGENDNGIFFFTPDGKYIEWTGIYLYSDIPFEVENPVIQIGG